MAIPKNIKQLEKDKFVDDGSGNPAVRTALVAKDIQIGAVELKDGTSDLRGKIVTNPNTDNNELLVNLQGHQCPENSTTDNLGIGGVFTGSGWQDTLDYGVVSINVSSDQDSAVDGLDIQWSNDGATIRDHDYFTVLANTAKTFTFGPAERYYRVVYTNGGVATTDFHLTSLLRRVYVKPSSHRINDAIVGQDDAELVKAVSTGLAPDGTFKNVLVTNAGNQKISIEEFETDVSTVNAAFSTNMDGLTGLNSSAVMYGRVDDNTVVPIKLDGSTQDIQVVEHEHAEIHSGDHYNYCDYALAQGLGAIIEFVFTTPNTTLWTHLVFEVFSSTGATIELYEGTTTVAGGTTITPRNNNRNSANTSSITLIKDPASIGGDGTRAAGFLAGAGRTAGVVIRDREYVLKQNEAYLVRVTSLAASNNIGWCAEWYEHTDKN